MADVLKVAPTASIKLSRNGIVLYNQRYAPAEVEYTEHTAYRLVLAANMGAPQSASMGGVTTGKYVMIKSDRPIKVALNDITKLIDIGADSKDGAILLIGTVTSIYLQNVHPTYEATVDIVVAGS